MGNFEFLEKINPSIANLAETAEKLFRDEYFDQCITQTRKMAEIMTRNVLGSKAEEDDTFDDMLYKLKTISNNNFREQEFISDMYFLKKHGNIAVHSQMSGNSGKIALECLEHVFEASVNYAYAITHSDKINKLIFDEKLLMLGEKNTSLQESYKEKLAEEKENRTEQYESKQTKPKQKSTKKDTTKNINSQPEKNTILLKVFSLSVIFALLIIITLSVLNNISKISTPDFKRSKKNISANKIIKENKPVSKHGKFSMTKIFSEIKN